MKLKNLAFNLMGRRAAYRLGRAMYLHARGEVDHGMAVNGEMFVQRAVLNAWKNASIKDERLVIFDVGANIGDWSSALLGQLKAHAISERVDVFAFEPVPSTAETFRRNLAGKQPCLHIEELALSSSNGTAEIYVSSANAGSNSMYDDTMSTEKKKISIYLTSAAEFCEVRGIKRVHLLKCDTEGHDMEVIRGALPLLMEERILVLQFEYNHRWVFSRSFLRDVFLAIESLPYKLAKLQADRLLVFEKWHPELDTFFHGNYVLIHDDALPWFPVSKAYFVDLIHWRRRQANARRFRGTYEF